ncbi:hypothetical protein [Rhodococcus sp. 077-4]|uniref:hypothetical protein n=1 Tax=Rhodococcus sp. 077-4 TaxID=2789271 RepID=UPI0039F62F09
MWGYSLIALALACSSLGAWWAAVDYSGRRMPSGSQRHTWDKSRRVRRIEFVAWLSAFFGAIAVANQLWMSNPWVTGAFVCAIMVLVNGLPAFLITLVHNRKPESVSPM